MAQLFSNISNLNWQQAVMWLIGGVLPLEEVIFFLMTNALVTLGLVLVLATESHRRFHQIGQWLSNRRSPRAGKPA